MKITKYEHACFTVEENGQVLVVDPGAYTTDFTAPTGVVAVIITHEHTDHMDQAHLQTIVDTNPDVVIISHSDITSQLGGFKSMNVVPGEGVKVGNFTLEFYGGKHATIYPELPAVANVGVMIGGRLYYPGDSFALPGREVEVLALPVSAPWMKLSEAIDFAKAVNPKMIFPTHDAVLSDFGKGLPDRLVPSFVPNVEYKRLQEPLVI